MAWRKAWSARGYRKIEQPFVTPTVNNSRRESSRRYDAFYPKIKRRRDEPKQGMMDREAAQKRNEGRRGVPHSARKYFAHEISSQNKQRPYVPPPTNPKSTVGVDQQVEPTNARPLGRFWHPSSSIRCSPAIIACAPEPTSCSKASSYTAEPHTQFFGRSVT